MKTAREINAENLDNWIKSLSKDKTVHEVRGKRKIKRSTTTTDKVCGEQPVIVPKNQLNLIYET